MTVPATARATGAIAAVGGGGGGPRVLVLDAGTSSVRAVVVDGDGHVVHQRHQELLPTSPAPGRVEFDASALAAGALALARDAVSVAGPVEAVGITNQRSSTVVWDRSTGEPVGPGLGWQDLRTEDRCLDLLAQGLLVGPNFCLTKAAWLIDQAGGPAARDLCVGTVDTWLAWHLSKGALHVTDTTNASAGGPMWSAERGDWDADVLAAAGVPVEVMPRIVASSGPLGAASALDGAPVIAGLAGDQQAALVGQGCLSAGTAKLTLGTGGMLDVHLGPHRPFDLTGPQGCMVMAAAGGAGPPSFVIEAVMLAAGTNVEWLRDGLGVITSAADSHTVAQQCRSSEGVVFVPALLGLGTPYWDFAATGTLLGVTRGTGRPHIVRAVLEGIAQRSADLVEAAEADSGATIDALRVDGGMVANPTLVQAIADAIGRPVDVAPMPGTTSLGAAFLAGSAVGVWRSWDDVADVWGASRRVEPAGSFDRDRWRDACRRAASLAVAG